MVTAFLTNSHIFCVIIIHYHPRNIVEDILKEIDPEGTELRKKHRLKRRLYRNPGPNHACHLDGYDKLKPWGFPVHGVIDGFSRKILWLRVTRSKTHPTILLVCISLR